MPFICSIVTYMNVYIYQWFIILQNKIYHEYWTFFTKKCHF